MPCDTTFRFMDLPVEVRQNCYRFLLNSSKTADSPEYCLYTEEHFGGTAWNFDLGILRASKTIYEESIDIFRRENSFILLEAEEIETITNFFDTEFPPRLDASVHDYVPWSLRVYMSYHKPPPGEEPQPRKAIVLLAQELTELCIQVFADKADETNPATQGIYAQFEVAGQHEPWALLKPFLMWRALGEVEVMGNIDGRVAQQVKETMTSATWDTTMLMSIVREIQDYGHYSARYGSYEFAVKNFEYALAVLDHIARLHTDIIDECAEEVVGLAVELLRDIILGNLRVAARWKRGFNPADDKAKIALEIFRKLRRDLQRYVFDEDSRASPDGRAGWWTQSPGIWNCVDRQSQLVKRHLRDEDVARIYYYRSLTRRKMEQPEEAQKYEKLALEIADGNEEVKKELEALNRQIFPPAESLN